MSKLFEPLDINGMVIPNANAGLLSVRPHLAGSASGFSGIMMIGIGAALSALAASALSPTSGAMPLLVIMLVSAILLLLAAYFVIIRERQLAQS